MSRMRFIESYGATCRNWQWSWAFVNRTERFVIFGAWDAKTSAECSVILRKEWEKPKGRKKPGFGEAIEYIGLVKEGYRLAIFQMHEVVPDSANGNSTIKGFSKQLLQAELKEHASEWTATPTGPFVR